MAPSVRQLLNKAFSGLAVESRTDNTRPVKGCRDLLGRGQLYGSPDPIDHRLVTKKLSTTQKNMNVLSRSGRLS